MTRYRQELGKYGEDLAARELRRRGYAILAKRFRTRYGEIDIVARDGETIVIVEVKARVTNAFGTASEAVTLAKQRKLASMATEFLVRKRLTNRPCRFDVVAIDGPAFNAKITVIRCAFSL